MATDLTLYRMFGIDFYDSVIAGGQFQIDQIRALEEKRESPAKEMKLLGIPYMDVMLQRLKDTPAPEKKDRPLILLAPSWGESSILNKFGSEFIDRLIDTGYDIVIRPHPQSFTSEKELMDKLMARYKDGDKVTWNRDTDNFDILRRADILISDFSGVLFDFTLVYDKPIIYVDTDFSDAQYDACWLEETPWTFRVLPSLGKQLNKDNANDIKKVIDECLSGSDSEELARGRDQARAESWVNIGKSAPLVTDYLCAKYDELTKQPETKTTVNKSPKKKTNK